MEKQRVENRDGSVEAVIAKTDPFAIVRCAFADSNFNNEHTVG